jgi:hypothetical protein
MRGRTTFWSRIDSAHCTIVTSCSAASSAVGRRGGAGSHRRCAWVSSRIRNHPLLTHRRLRVRLRSSRTTKTRPLFSQQRTCLPTAVTAEMCHERPFRSAAISDGCRPWAVVRPDPPGARSGHLPTAHSITSSAVVRSDGATVMPSACAVFRLITSSNLFGFWTAMSAGLAPFRMRST